MNSFKIKRIHFVIVLFFMSYLNAQAQSGKFSKLSRKSTYVYTYEFMTDSTYKYAIELRNPRKKKITKKKEVNPLNYKLGDSNRGDSAPLTIDITREEVGYYTRTNNLLKLYRSSSHLKDCKKGKGAQVYSRFVLDTVGERIINSKTLQGWRKDRTRNKINLPISLTDSLNKTESTYYLPIEITSKSKEYFIGKSNIRMTCRTPLDFSYAVNYFIFFDYLKQANFDFDSVVQNFKKKELTGVLESNIELVNGQKIALVYDQNTDLLLKIAAKKKKYFYTFKYNKCGNITSIHYFKKKKLINTYQLTGYDRK